MHLLPPISISSLLLYPLLAPFTQAIPAQIQTCNVVSNVTQTFYGIPNNDNNGASIAFNCGRRGRIAGGIGSYRDPVTFASAPGEFRRCEIIYSPYLRKYLQHQDHCRECTIEWSFRIPHIVVWVGSNRVGGGADQLNCQERLTPPPESQSVIRNPRQNLTVDATPLYVQGLNRNRTCNVNHVYPSYDVREFC